VSWLHGGEGERGGGSGLTYRPGAGGAGGGMIPVGSNNSDDSGLRKLREGLDLAADRTDELALRRVWGKVAELPAPRPRYERTLLVAGFGLLALGLGAIGFALSLHIAELSPVARQSGDTAGANHGDEPVPVLLGPATVQTGSAEARRVRLKGGALISVAAQTTLTVDAGQRPSVSRGRIGLEVPRQPPGEQFTVEAGPYMIVVVGTKFDVGMGPRQVEVSVKEGVVEVWRDGKMVRLRAGNSWQGPLQSTSSRLRRSQERKLALATLARVPLARGSVGPSEESIRQRPSDRFEQAKLALATGDAAAGLEILRDLATGNGPIAENSAYEIGLVLRDRHHEPRLAIDAWKQYRKRFPRGLLRAEADLSIVETELELGEHAAAMEEAQGFLRRHPRSERRTEVEGLVQRLAFARASSDLVSGSTTATAEAEVAAPASAGRSR
jgi:hypothetical protein